MSCLSVYHTCICACIHAYILHIHCTDIETHPKMQFVVWHHSTSRDTSEYAHSHNIDCLTHFITDWLTDSLLPHWLTHWLTPPSLTDSRTGWLTDSLIDSLTHSLTDVVTHLPTDCLSKSLTNSLTFLLTADWHNESLNDWSIYSQIDSLTDLLTH